MATRGRLGAVFSTLSEKAVVHILLLSQNPPFITRNPMGNGQIYLILSPKLHLRLRPPPNPIMLLTTRHQKIHILRIHHPRPRLLHVRDPRQPHTRLQLILQYLAQVLHALLPVAQTVQERPPDPHSRGPKRERFENIRAARDAAVHVDLAPAEDVRADAVYFQ